MAQNLISASLSAEDVAALNQSLATIKSKLSFLKSIQPSEIQSIFKASNGFYPLVVIAKEVETSHPEILSGVFDREEFNKDYVLYEQLRPLLQQINELQETLQKTNMALSGDLMSATLDVYSAVKQNKDKVPGLNATYEKMKVFFKKSKKSDSSNISE